MEEILICAHYYQSWHLQSPVQRQSAVPPEEEYYNEIEIADDI